jgi:hypothetical protein
VAEDRAERHVVSRGPTAGVSNKERKQSDAVLYTEYKKLSNKTLVEKNNDRVTATCTWCLA